MSSDHGRLSGYAFQHCCSYFRVTLKNRSWDPLRTPFSNFQVRACVALLRQHTRTRTRNVSECLYLLHGRLYRNRPRWMSDCVPPVLLTNLSMDLCESLRSNLLSIRTSEPAPTVLEGVWQHLYLFWHREESVRFLRSGSESKCQTVLTVTGTSRV